MPSYGWTAYDVRKGGVQVINDTDNKVDLVTEFAKVSDDNWGLRIKGIPREDAKDLQKTSVIFYIGSEDSNATVKCTKGQDSKASPDDVVCDGTMASLNNFKVAFTGHRGDRGSLRRLSAQSLTVPADTIWQAKSIFIKQLAQDGSNEAILPDNPGEGNLHFVQGIFEAEFKFDVLFSSGPDQDVTTSSALTKGVQEALSTFNARFQSVYQPQTPFNDQQHIKFSQALLSNLMGGIGYFYGTSKLDVSSAAAYDETNQNFWEEIAAAQAHAVVEDRGPYQLFSAVPSRPYFPRGFLWDEGFHLQVILEWDMDLALDIVASWFAMTSEDGWIAREQILGQEARSKVPPEFLTQYNHYANPPTLFFVIQTFLEKLDGVSTYSGAPSHYLSDSRAAHAYMRVFYIKSVRHYGWFLRKQAGNLKHYKVPGSSGDIKQGYRWRGRTPQHLLTSGLDDYPRAQPPHPAELHVDALSWVGVMAVVLEKAAVFLKHPIDVALFSKHVDEVVRSIDAIHWSEPDQAYCDTTIVAGDQVEMVCHKGYVSLFPFLTGLMGANHTHLGAVLNLIRDPEELWTPYGLRSLSPKDKYYGKDENYWRGPIWINMNYMALQRLLVSILHLFFPISVKIVAQSIFRKSLNNQALVNRSRLTYIRSFA